MAKKKESRLKSSNVGKNERSRILASNKVTGIFVHYSDCLNLDVHLFHPSVKVMFINLENGNFIAKQDKDKSVTCYEEGNVKHILPLITQPFIFRNSRTLVPRWEELLLFNENFSYLKSYKEKLGIFFLVQDFVSMSKANNRKKTTESGWRDVAWAFLKPFPNQEINNTEKKVRLQLFQPNIRKDKDLEESSILWNWWSTMKHEKYPSSIYVTVQAIDPPSGDASKNPFNNVQNLTNNLESENLLKSSLEKPKIPIWSRGPGQACHIPKEKIAELNCAGGGVSYLKFSKDGLYLAVASPSRKGTSNLIFIYDVPEWNRITTLEGHRGPIYELDWFGNATLLSCSGDGTAIVWHLALGEKEIMEHPSFVYSAKFHPNTPDVIVTGSYDRVIRIWRRSNSNNDPESESNGEKGFFVVTQELVTHQKYITALEFDSDGQNLYSGDKGGSVKVWEVIGSSSIEQFHQQNENTSLYFRLRKELNLSELEGYAIESLKIHPGGRRLLIHSASLVSSLLMIDLTRPNPAVMQEYKVHNGKRKIGNLITPCGSYVFSGSKHSGVHVWDTDSGEEKHFFESPIINSDNGSWAEEIGTMCFHPLDHIIVFGALDKFGMPVCAYKYKEELKL